LGKLGPGQRRQVEYQVTAKKLGRFCVRLAAATPEAAAVEAEACVTVGAARLELDVAGPDRRLVTQPATDQITVTDAATAPVTNLVLTDPLPAQTAFVTASDGGRLSDREVRWALGSLPPGARRTVQVALQAQGPGEVVNRVTAAADRGLSARAE